MPAPALPKCASTATLRRVCVLLGLLVLFLAAPSTAAASWRGFPIGGVQVLSCPDASLCVGIDNLARIVSGNPTGGTTAFTRSASVIPADDGNRILPTGISCPTISFCAAVDNGGNVATSADPTGGAGAWSGAQIGSGEFLTAISCPTPMLCVASSTRHVFTSTNPTGGAGTWRAAHLGSPGTFLAISCPTAKLCTAVGGNNEVFTSTDPSGGGGTWKATSLGTLPNRNGLDLVGISCPTARFCVAVDGVFGNVFVSTDPTGGPNAWKLTNTGENDGLTGVSCPILRLCVATQRYQGTLLVSLDPDAGARSWVSVRVAPDRTGIFPAGLYDVVCAPPQTCVALFGTGGTSASEGDVAGKAAFVSTHAAAPAERETKPDLAGAASLTGIAKRHPRVALTVYAGIPPAGTIRSIVVSLPRGLAFRRGSLSRGILVRGLRGKRLRFAVKLRHGALTIVPARAVFAVGITISPPAVATSGSSGGELAFRVGITDTRGVTTMLTRKLRPR